MGNISDRQHFSKTVDNVACFTLSTLSKRKHQAGLSNQLKDLGSRIDIVIIIELALGLTPSTIVTFVSFLWLQADHYIVDTSPFSSIFPNRTIYYS